MTPSAGASGDTMSDKQHELAFAAFIATCAFTLTLLALYLRA